ncbi:sigma factor-like helix-turn-helix DNA-binding protein [Streptomyces galilaeus]|uniref:sigma factor-like helix-turn-helix DNA-binding protein n=1 Tax=Streptomyces galilaeus TaxID=33899 RepID=UPI0038F60DA1
MPRRKPSAHFAKQAQEAYELSLSGLSYRQIAEEMGVSLGTVQKRLALYIETRVHPKADEYRARQIDSLHMYLRALRKPIATGDPKAIANAVRIQERIAKLLGLDSATAFKVEVNDVTRESDAAEVQQMIDAYFGRTSAEPRDIPHIDLSQRKGRPHSPEYLAKEAKQDEFWKGVQERAKEKREQQSIPELDELEEIAAMENPDDIEEKQAAAEGFTEPVSKKEWDKKRMRPHSNPSLRYLRDSDD